MATNALTQDIFFALRQKIARIENAPPQHLRAAAEIAVDRVLLRRNGAAMRGGLLATGAIQLDAALGGGLPLSALTEIHGRETRDAGAVAGFALALAALMLDRAPGRPVLWIGTAEIHGEAGFPYGLGLANGFGVPVGRLLLAEAARLADVLWIAEEAASLKALGVVILELRGNPARLDLTATRRLHRRAQMAARPVLLLRHGAVAEPTAAPVRLVVSPAASSLRETLAGLLPRSIGPPAFHVALSKSRTAPAVEFTLEWNADERLFRDRRPAADDGNGHAHPRAARPGAVLSLSRA